MPPEYIFDQAEDPAAGQEENGMPTRSAAQQNVDPQAIAQQQISDMEFGARFSEELERVGNETRDLLSNRGSSPESKTDKLIDALATMLPAALREAGSAAPNPDRSLVISRATILTKSIAEMIREQEKAKQEATINPHSPRFKQVQNMFLDDVVIAFSECGASDAQRELFFNALADRMRGFEERVEAMNTLSAAARAKRVNPHTMKMLEGKATPRGDTSNRVN